MPTFSAVLAQLDQERAQITSQLTALSRALAVLNGRGPNLKSGARTRTMSAAARARIAAAQRARWAKVKNKKVDYTRKET